VSRRVRPADINCRRCGVTLGTVRLAGILRHFKTNAAVRVRFLENGDLELICPCGFETIFRWERKEAA